jgi:hypothetical protein
MDSGQVCHFVEEIHEKAVNKLYEIINLFS